MVSVLTAVSKKKRTNNGVPLELLSEWAETGKQTAQQTLSVLDGVSAMEKGKAEKGHGVQGGAGWGSGSILSKGDRHSPAPHREGSTCATAQRGGVHTMYREDGTEKWMNTEALAGHRQGSCGRIPVKGSLCHLWSLENTSQGTCMLPPRRMLQMGVSFLFSFAFWFSFIPSYL